MTDGILDAGDQVEMTLRVVNNASTANAKAFDLVVEDALDKDIFENIQFTGIPAGFTPEIIDQGDSNLIRFTAQDGITVDIGQELAFTFTATLATTVKANEFVQESAKIAEYSTLPGVDSEERVVRDVESNEVGLQIATIETEKDIIDDTGTVIADPQFTIGETVKYSRRHHR
jgi:hypothetical protein